MLKYLLNPTKITKSLVWVLNQQEPDQIFHLFTKANPARKANLWIADVILCLIVSKVGVVEGRTSN